MLVTQSCSALCSPVDIAHQSPLSTGSSRQEYWSGLPFPSPGDLPDQGIKPRSPALEADFLPSEPPGKPRLPTDFCKKLRFYPSCGAQCHQPAWLCFRVSVSSARTLLCSPMLDLSGQSWGFSIPLWQEEQLLAGSLPLNLPC